MEKAKAKAKTIKTNNHHIIAKSAKGAKPARTIWLKYYGINDKRNLITINYNLHIFLHTQVYYNAVNTIITNADKKGVNGVLAAMALIRGVLYTFSAAL